MVRLLAYGSRNNALQRPKVDYYQMGETSGSASIIPLKGTKYVDLYLTSAGRANTLYGDGKLSFDRPKSAAADTFVYDP